MNLNLKTGLFEKHLFKKYFFMNVKDDIQLNPSDQFYG